MLDIRSHLMALAMSGEALQETGPKLKWALKRAVDADRAADPGPAAGGVAPGSG